MCSAVAVTDKTAVRPLGTLADSFCDDTLCLHSARQGSDRGTSTAAAVAVADSAALPLLLGTKCFSGESGNDGGEKRWRRARRQGRYGETIHFFFFFFFSSSIAGSVLCGGLLLLCVCPSVCLTVPFSQPAGSLQWLLMLLCLLPLLLPSSPRLPSGNS